MPLSKIMLDKEFEISDTTINGEHFYQIRDFVDVEHKEQMIADVEAYKVEGSGEYEEVFGNTDFSMEKNPRFQTDIWKKYYDRCLAAVEAATGKPMKLWTSWSATAYASDKLENWWHTHKTDIALVYYLQNFEPCHGTVWRPEPGEEIMVMAHENSVSFFTADWEHDGTFGKWRANEFYKEHPRYVLAAEYNFI